MLKIFDIVNKFNTNNLFKNNIWKGHIYKLTYRYILYYNNNNRTIPFVQKQVHRTLLKNSQWCGSHPNKNGQKNNLSPYCEVLVGVHITLSIVDNNKRKMTISWFITIHKASSRMKNYVIALGFHFPLFPLLAPHSFLLLLFFQNSILFLFTALLSANFILQWVGKLRVFFIACSLSV